MVIGGLTVILLLVLTLPFMIKKVEENLEPFLFVMGILAAIISGKINTHLVLEALQEPIMIASVVLVAGILFFVLKDQFSILMSKLLQKVPISALVAAIVLLLGFAVQCYNCYRSFQLSWLKLFSLLPLKRQTS